jgi:hypothetical protein
MRSCSAWHRDRQVGVAKQLFSALGIERDNKDKRQDWVLRGFRQCDAPVCVIITYDRVLDGSDDTPFDCGAVATALVNAAWSRGLGAVKKLRCSSVSTIRRARVQRALSGITSGETSSPVIGRCIATASMH